MATFNQFKKDQRELGFGSKYSGEARYINPDGTFNVVKRGLPFYKTMSVYYNLISMPTGRFILMVFSFYLVVNLLFATAYYTFCKSSLAGISPNSNMGYFWEAFFFSCQTFTTVGYGRVNPEGSLANIIAAIESFAGLMAFALATGLLYGRFARPKADLIFSENSLVAPYHGMNALMFRVAHLKNHVLNNVECQMILAMAVDENGVKVRRFYQLKLELSKINFLSLTWTVVHPIDDESPMKTMNQADFENADAEILILLRGYDDVFSQEVHKRYSYKYTETVWGAKFVSLLGNITSDKKQILDLSRLGEFERVPLNSFENA